MNFAEAVTCSLDLCNFLSRINRSETFRILFFLQTLTFVLFATHSFTHYNSWFLLFDLWTSAYLHSNNFKKNLPRWRSSSSCFLLNQDPFSPSLSLSLYISSSPLPMIPIPKHQPLTTSLLVTAIAAGIFKEINLKPLFASGNEGISSLSLTRN